MDNFIKNIKKKLSVDNVFEFDKEVDVDDTHEEDIRKTIEKVEPNDAVDVDEIASKLSELSEKAKAVIEDKPVQDVPKANINILQKPTQPEQTTEKEDPYIKEDNILAFID